MSTSFPSAIDTFTNPQAGDRQNSPSHSEQHANANDAIEALEAKVGVDGSAVPSSLDYRVTVLEAGNHTHVFNEAPTGDIDGANDEFTLAAEPIAGTLMLFFNGLLQRAGGNDFTLVGDTITFTEPPPTGSLLLASYVT